MYLYIVTLVVILRNWVSENWVHPCAEKCDFEMSWFKMYGVQPLGLPPCPPVCVNVSSEAPRALAVQGLWRGWA